ncbi:PHOsphatase [Phlyctochytrium planicorne]|nr:PHOsphatase [Phlyctochytrium planicorne]
MLLNSILPLLSITAWILATVTAAPAPASVCRPKSSSKCPKKLQSPKKILDTTPAIVDDHLVIVSKNPKRSIKASTKSRYVPPKTFNQPECKVIQVQMVARHGTRNPTGGDVKKFKELQKSLKAALPSSNPKFPFLTTFQVPADDTTAGLLTTQGVKDHQFLAKFIQKTYPFLVKDTSSITWQATNVSRALASGESFIKELLKDKKDRTAAISFLQSATVPQAIDADLRPFDACQNYINASETAKADPPEKAFSKSQFPAIATRLSQALETTTPLTIDDVASMFNMCAFQNTLQGDQSQFCSLFTDAELAQFDFFQDLKNNADEGYPLAINEKLACSLLTTIDNNMKLASDDKCGSPKAVFKFAHEETVLPILTTLGLFKDEIPLSPKMTPDQIASRKLKFADVSPFAGNIIFELQDCGSSKKKDLKVRVLVGQREVVVPGCKSATCPIKEFRSALEGKIGCDFDKDVCGNKVGSVGGSATFKTLEEIPFDQVLNAVTASA